MTHAERLEWLASHGWLTAKQVREVYFNKGGCRWLWLEVSKGGTLYSAWLCIQDGRIEFDGACSVMPWEQFLDWLVEPVQPVVQPAKSRARSLFDDLEDA